MFADTNGGNSWSNGNQSRRPFSYAFGTEPPPSYNNKPISPRNVSNSSASVHPQNNTSSSVSTAQNGSQSSRVGNFGTNPSSAAKGDNYASFGNGNFMSDSSSTGRNGFSSGVNPSVQNKSVMSPSANISMSQTHNTKTRNSLFSSSQPKGGVSHNDLFNTKPSYGAGSTNRQNKSFWWRRVQATSTQVREADSVWMKCRWVVNVY